MINKKTNDSRLTKLTEKQEKRQEQYDLLKEEFILDVTKFEKDMDYVLTNNDYYRNFLSWLSMFDFIESIMANKVLKYTLESIDDKCLKNLFSDFNMDRYYEFLLLHNTIKDIVKYLSECRKKEIELNKVGISLLFDEQKIKILRNIKRYNNEN